MWVSLIASIVSVLVGIVSVLLLKSISKSYYKLQLIILPAAAVSVAFYFATLFVELQISPQLFAGAFVLFNVGASVAIRIHTKNLSSNIEKEMKESIAQETKESIEEELMQDRDPTEDIAAKNKQMQKEIEEIYANNPPDKAEQLLKEKQKEWARK